MKFEQQKMAKWYDARKLASIGIKTLISSIFGNFADRRELQAAIEAEASFNYSQQEELWIDYIADTGDGFHSTFTVASLLAKDSLDFDNGNIKTKRGEILVMGGDEVYPTPEKIQYKNRLQGPFNAAYPWDDKKPQAHLFALPGNHDWYDGLSNFIKLFCQGRALGNWHTQQKRSYFALKLPHGYWLWGIDVQLESDIDKPQMDYFDKIGNEAKPNDKVILCTAEPAWVYNSVRQKDVSFDRLDFFTEKYITKKEMRVAAMLTGDLHHYSHYIGKDKSGSYQHLITAGGGGAFTHPTHFLKSEINLSDRSYRLCANYPSRADSIKLLFLNLLFPFLNWGVPLAIGIFHLITTWFLQSFTESKGGLSFMETINEYELSWAHVMPVIAYIGSCLTHSPIVVIFNLLLIVGIIAFTDTSFGKHRWNLLAGIPHATLQLMALYFLIWLFSRINLTHLHRDIEHLDQVLFFSAEMILIGGFISGMLFGIYLIISALLFKAHPTEAFSSLRWTGYKNFLRIHITKDKVTVYPVGMKKIVNNWKNVGTEDKPKFMGDEIKCELIEPSFTLNGNTI
jgi:hypothetical protein